MVYNEIMFLYMINKKVLFLFNFYGNGIFFIFFVWLIEFFVNMSFCIVKVGFKKWNRKSLLFVSGLGCRLGSSCS